MKAHDFLIRADASNQIGSGHIMRMIALGQKLISAGHTVHVFTIPHHQGLMGRLESEGFILHFGDKQLSRDVAGDAAALLAVAKSIEPKWVILDGYQYDTAYQNSIKSGGFKVLCLDDPAEYAFSADAVLNQNFHARPERYRVGETTRLFLGPRYAMLRKEFSESRRSFQRQTPQKVENIIVTLGGGDSENVTGRILSALRDPRMRSARLKVVIGSLNPHYADVCRLARDLPGTIEILTNVTTEMAELFQWADLGITAAGSTTLEALFMELPCFVISLAANQDSVLDELREKRIAFAFSSEMIANGEFKAAFYNLLEDEAEHRACVSRMRALGIGGQAHEVVARLVGDIEIRFISRDYVINNIEAFCDFSHNFLYSPWQADNFLKDLPGKWKYSAVALKGERIVGFAFNSQKESTTVYTHLLMIAEQYQGSGIGAFLTRSIAAKARRNAIRRLRLRCPVDNKAAADFYKSLGFAIEAVLDDELSHPHQDYLLSKEL